MMALVLTLLIFLLLSWGGYHVGKWASRSWYPPRLMLTLGVSLVMGLAVTAAIGRLAA